MQAQRTVRDGLSTLARLSNILLPRIAGAYMGLRMGWLHGIMWGWRYLYIHPCAVFVVEPGATIDIRGRLCIGFSLKKDVPLPGKRRTGLVVKKDGVFRAGENVHLVVGSTVHVSAAAKVEIGDRTFVSYDCAIIARNSIAIGSDCAISWGVTILDSHLHKAQGVPYTQPVQIGSRVWIGHNVTILQGVTVGDGAIIGAHSLVNADVPPHAVAAGVPARVIKENVTWEL